MRREATIYSGRPISAPGVAKPQHDGSWRAPTNAPACRSDSYHIRRRGAKSFVDDLVLSRGVVLSRADLFCDLLRLSPLTRRFVSFRLTYLRSNMNRVLWSISASSSMQRWCAAVSAGAAVASTLFFPFFKRMPGDRFEHLAHFSCAYDMDAGRPFCVLVHFSHYRTTHAGRPKMNIYIIEILMCFPMKFNLILSLAMKHNKGACFYK